MKLRNTSCFKFFEFCCNFFSVIFSLNPLYYCVFQVADLRVELKQRGLSTTGNKNELVERLQLAIHGGSVFTLFQFFLQYKYLAYLWKDLFTFYRFSIVLGWNYGRDFRWRWSTWCKYAIQVMILTIMLITILIYYTL